MTWLLPNVPLPMPREAIEGAEGIAHAGGQGGCRGACGRSPPGRILVGMSGGTDNLVVEMLRAIRGDIGALREDMREMKGRMSAVELGLAALRREIATLAEADAHLGVRIDRLHDRLDRIERRLDLADHPAG